MKQNCITIRTQEEGRPIGDLFGIFYMAPEWFPANIHRYDCFG